MAVDVGSAVGYLDLDISKFLENIKKAQQEEEKAKDKFEKAGDKISAVGGKLSSAGKLLTVGVTTPLVGLGTQAVKTSANFESALSKVGAISSDAKGRMDELKAKAMEMGATTKFSATEAAEAMQYMGMAGWGAQDMMDGLSGIMNLAAADGLDLATTSDIVTDALTAFGLSAKDSGHFADILAAASSSANTNVSMLGESFKYVAPVAGALGYNAEDTAVALGLMANAGIKASQGGTALRTILTNLASPTAEIKNAMDDLGISITNNDGTMKSLDEVMESLRESFGEMKIPIEEFQSKTQELDKALADSAISESDYNREMQTLTERAYGAEGALKAQYAATIAGKTGMSGLLAIVSASNDDYNNLAEAIRTSSDAMEGQGRAAEMAQDMIDNLNGQFTIIKSTLGTLAIQFGDILLPYIKQFAEFLQNLLNVLTSMSEKQKSVVATIAVVIASIGPLLLIVGNIVKVVGSVVSHVKNIISVISKLTPILKSLWVLIAANPVVLIIAAIVALIATFVLLYKKCEWFRNGVNNIFNKVKEIFTSFGNAIKTLFTQTIPNFITTLFGKFKTFGSNIVGIFKNIPSQMLTIGKNIVQGIWNGISGATSWIKEKIAGFASGLIGSVKDKLGIHSPSRVFRDQIGKMLPPGIADGFEDAMPKATREIKDNLERNIKNLQSKMQGLSVYGKSLVYGDTDFSSFNVPSGFDYGRMAEIFREIMREYPIQNNVTVEMQDGDVIMDSERVGKKVAPTVSRVIGAGI